VAVVLGSGERKSAAVKLLAEPIHKFEERQKASYLERLLRWMALLAQVEDALDSLVTERKKLERKEADLRARLVLEQDEATRKEIEEQLAEIVARKQALVGQIAALRAQRKMLLEDMPYARRVRV